MSRDLQKVIKDTIIKYKEIIFGADSPIYIYIEYLNKLRKQQALEEKVYGKKKEKK